MHTIRSDASGAAGKKPLFAGEIRGWSSWARVFQDIKLFRPLVQEICRLHDLPFQEPENLTPGTNAVFAVGDMVFKIYAPAEAGFDQSADCDTELFALRRCHSLGVSVPTVIASGTLQDRYAFRYLVQSRCVGKAFREIWPMPDPCETALSVMESTPAEFFTVESTPAEISAMKSTSAKVDFGRNLRRLLARCEPRSGSCRQMGGFSRGFPRRQAPNHRCALRNRMAAGDICFCPRRSERRQYSASGRHDQYS